MWRWVEAQWRMELKARERVVYEGEEQVREQERMVNVLARCLDCLQATSCTSSTPSRSLTRIPHTSIHWLSVLHTPPTLPQWDAQEDNQQDLVSCPAHRRTLLWRLCRLQEEGTQMRRRLIRNPDGDPHVGASSGLSDRLRRKKEKTRASGARAGVEGKAARGELGEREKQGAEEKEGGGAGESRWEEIGKELSRQEKVQIDDVNLVVEEEEEAGQEEGEGGGEGESEGECSTGHGHRSPEVPHHPKRQGEEQMEAEGEGEGEDVLDFVTTTSVTSSNMDSDRTGEAYPSESDGDTEVETDTEGVQGGTFMDEKKGEGEKNEGPEEGREEEMGARDGPGDAYGICTVKKLSMSEWINRMPSPMRDEILMGPWLDVSTLGIPHSPHVCMLVHSPPALPVCLCI